MRLLRLALCALFLPILAQRVRAADDDKDHEPQAPEEIPNFNQLDEFIYVPKTTLSLGSRFIVHGPKATYSGQGDNPSPVDPGSADVSNVSHTYIDGTVSPDQRTVTTSAGLGGTTTTGIQNDGKTNTWSYDYNSQLLPNGNIAFHTYDEEINDTGSHPASSDPGLGLELILDRDMGKILKTKLKWSLTAGFSIADIHTSTYDNVPTLLTTTTDTYDLFGQVPPSAPFTSPNTITQTVYGQGSTVTTGSGSGATQEATQTILLGNIPLSRVVSGTEVLSENRYFTEGAYYTLRAGPTLDVPFGSKWQLTISAGPALIYSGATMNVLEDFELVSGTNYYTTYQKENNHLLPAYYVDVNIRYALTDTAGFYIGGMLEGAGSYTQTVASGTNATTGAQTEYSSRIDFGDQQGVKGGITVRF